MERLFEAVAALRHRFSANGDTNIDAAGDDLVGDVLDTFEARRAEAVYGGGPSCGGVPSCEGGGTNDVGGFSVGDLELIRRNQYASELITDIAETDVLNELRINP